MLKGGVGGEHTTPSRFYSESEVGTQKVDAFHERRSDVSETNVGTRQVKKGKTPTRPIPPESQITTRRRTTQRPKSNAAVTFRFRLSAISDTL